MDARCFSGDINPFVFPLRKRSASAGPVLTDGGSRSIIGKCQRFQRADLIPGVLWCCLLFRQLTSFQSATPTSAELAFPTCTCTTQFVSCVPRVPCVHWWFEPFLRHCHFLTSSFMYFPFLASLFSTFPTYLHFVCLYFLHFGL